MREEFGRPLQRLTRRFQIAVIFEQVCRSLASEALHSFEARSLR
jgi:hypothetical protein